MAKRVTQKDIARALGVSYITVQRAVNNSGYVSRELKEKVLSYAREAHYVPHRAAQVLVRNKIRRIALFSSEYPGFFWNDISRGVSMAAEQIAPFNYEVTYAMTARADTAAYLSELEAVIDQGVHAVGIANNWEYDMARVIRRVEEIGVPYVTFNVDAPESRRLCYIGPDYREGGRLAAEFLGKLAGNGGLVGIISIVETGASSLGEAVNSTMRQRGFESYLDEKYPSIERRMGLIDTAWESRRVQEELVRFLSGPARECRALYYIPAFHRPLVAALEERQLAGRVAVVVHDLFPGVEACLERSVFSAVIYQNPILQGYYTVKILEELLESGMSPGMDHIALVHSLIMNENKRLHENNYLFARMMEAREGARVSDP